MDLKEKFHLRMTREINTTQTMENIGTWTGSSQVGNVEGGSCRLRVLYHVDLNRVGQVSSPDAFVQANPWLMIGRNARIFLDTKGDLATLEDPTISRKQCLLRWIEDEGVFEISPLTGAKLELSYLPLHTEGISTQLLPINERTKLPPGVCVAVGNRLLLGLERVETHHEAQQSRMGLIGESEQMWALRKNIAEVASFTRPALVLGPTGSGKELVSHAIHNQSPRQHKPFIVANCAALPDNIIESLLFGHQKGAFTGADSDHLGFFRAADQGTLFLDEIGELPITLQPKLLRVIQDGFVRPVGSEKTIKLDVRLIAATNRDPEQEIRAGRLREDLYHRLATYLLKVPSLNDRRFDIPELFASFLRRFRDEAPQSAWLWQGGVRWKKTIPIDWFIELLCLDWTGNVRQLENIAARVIQSNLHGPSFHPPLLPKTRSSDSSPSIEAMGSLSGYDISSKENDESKGGKTQDIEEDDEKESGELSENFQRTCELLDLAHKTVRKLLTSSAIDEIWENKTQEDEGDESEVAIRLHQIVSSRLIALLEANDFSQRRVCKELSISPSTLIKLMQRFEITRPSDLTIEMIEAVIAEVGDDLDLVAQRLRVSPQGLRRQLTLLNLKQS